jgi:hypothetical protein
MDQNRAMKGAICKSRLEEILEGEPWHYRYNRRAGLFEPVDDKCPPKRSIEV